MEKLTKELLIKEIKELKTLINDNEAAHTHEDYLYEWFIESLKKNMYATVEEITEMAIIVHETSNLHFERWCG